MTIKESLFCNWQLTTNFFIAHLPILVQCKPKAQSEWCAPYYAIGNYVPNCQLPEYTVRVVSNRYSQLKVCHRCQRQRWQMQKIFNHKSFNYLVWTSLGSLRIEHFGLQVHFKVSAAWYCSHYLPPVSLTPVANLPRVSSVANCNPC